MPNEWPYLRVLRSIDGVKSLGESPKVALLQSYPLNTGNSILLCLVSSLRSPQKNLFQAKLVQLDFSNFLRIIQIEN